MSKRPKTYDEERAMWYKKLKDSGFEDIEDDAGNLKTYEGGQFFEEHHLYDQLKHQTKEEQHQIAIEATTRYYQLATQFMHTYPFKRNLDKIVWEYHAVGTSRRRIATALTKE